MGKASRRKKIGANLARTQRGKPESICDFCGNPRPQWAYRTLDDPTEEGGTGGWAACSTCKGMIESGQHETHARHCARSILAYNPELVNVDVETLARGHADLFRRFRESRDTKDYDAQPLAVYVSKYGPPSNEISGARLTEAAARYRNQGITFGEVSIAGLSGRGEIMHRTETDSGVAYIPEGFTAEQLADPETIDHILRSVSGDRPLPNAPMTKPIRLKHWVGARTYMEAVGATYGENPRLDDLYSPKASMMMARTVLEPILTAHPLVLEPAQLNAIDDDDWSFAEASDYAKMAYLPFEPLYLDFGGHERVDVELSAGLCQLQGAVIWRSGFFKVPTLAVAPIGGYDYRVGPLYEKMVAEGVPVKDVERYVGPRAPMGTPMGTTTASDRAKYGPIGPQVVNDKAITQWRFQPAGICWFGVDTSDAPYPYSTLGMEIQMSHGAVEVPVVFGHGSAVATALGEQRLLEEGSSAVVFSGMWDDADREGGPGPEWIKLADGATEMVARMAERALLGLYFIENAPTQVSEVELSRPERRERERAEQKGRDPGEVASIVYIGGRRSESTRPTVSTEVEHQYRWERRGHFAHYHDNNRHYQLRPDLVKPCHKCEREYAANLLALRENRELPYPFCESPDCIKAWREPTVCGPEGAPLKKKVRIRRTDKPTERLIKEQAK